MKQLALLWILAVAAIAGGTEPSPETGKIHWPLTPPAPVVPPAPSPVTKLAAGQLFVVPAETPILLLASREGLVRISQLKAPVTIFGNFVDPQPGDDDGRSYSTGSVYVVRAVSAGNVELIAARDISGKGVERRVLDVSGDGPAPPGPGPGPTPPADPFARAVWDAYALETDSKKKVTTTAISIVFENITDADLTAAGSNAGLAKFLKTILANIPSGSLPKVEAIVIQELSATFPANGTWDKTKAAAELARISAALKGGVH